MYLQIQFELAAVLADGAEFVLGESVLLGGGYGYADGYLASATLRLRIISSRIALKSSKDISPLDGFAHYQAGYDGLERRRVVGVRRRRGGIIGSGRRRGPVF